MTRDPSTVLRMRRYPWTLALGSDRYVKFRYRVNAFRADINNVQDARRRGSSSTDPGRKRPTAYPHPSSSGYYYYTAHSEDPEAYKGQCKMSFIYLAGIEES